MKKYLFLVISFYSFQVFGQTNIKFFENLIQKTVEEIDPIVSKNNYDLRSSNFVQVESDTSLYGLKAKWANKKNWIITLERMMDYFPLFNSEKIEVGKVQVLKKTISFLTGGKIEAETILKNLTRTDYTKISSTTIDDGFEIKFESKKYTLTYRKKSLGEEHKLVYYFLLEAKVHQIIKEILN